MSHHEFAPCEELAGNIKCFWVQEETPEEFNEYPIIPDSYVELVFNCGAPVNFVSASGVEEHIPSVYLVGLQQKPIYLRSDENTRVLSVRFYAWAARPLVETSTSLPDQSIVPLDGIWIDLHRTVSQLLNQHGHAEAVACVQDFMLDMHRRMKYDLTAARKAGELLYDSRGQVSMSDLAERCYLSPSQFQRRMKQVLGLPAKTYARLIRYEYARNELFRNPYHSMADLVYDCGYTDQSHLIHEFKTFTEKTPGELAVYGMKNRSGHRQNEGFLQYP